MKKVLVVVLTLFIIISAGKVGKVLNAANYSSSAASMIVVEQNTGMVVAEKNAHQKRKMASTTKILTAITAIESGKDLEKLIKISPKAVGIEGSSIYLKNGEEMTLKNLLYGLMLRSGNDAAVAIAIEVGGSVEGFAKMMNEKAKEIGAVNSSFTNPHGLDDENHFTTASDLAKITCHAMKNPIFREIASTKTKRVDATESTPLRLFVNKNKILRLVEGGIGVKTGFTKKSGRCLVSAVERQGLTFICVVLNCDPMFEESVKLLENAHGEYMLYSVKFNKTYGVEVAGSENTMYNAHPKETSFEKIIKKSEESKFSIKETLFENLKAPLAAGSIVGKIEVCFNDTAVFTTNIVLKEEAKVREKTFDEIIKELIR